MAKKILKTLKANPIAYVRTTSSLITKTEESCIYLPWKDNPEKARIVN